MEPFDSVIGMVVGVVAVLGVLVMWLGYLIGMVGQRIQLTRVWMVSLTVLKMKKELRVPASEPSGMRFTGQIIVVAV